MRAQQKEKTLGKKTETKTEGTNTEITVFGRFFCHNLPGSKERGSEEYFSHTVFNSPNT